MEFKHLEYFVETSRHQSISKAAEALSISQQALSHCIVNMEQELGAALFSRSVKGIRLTEDGKYLYRLFAPQVERFHQALDETAAYFGRRPVKLPFCCAPLIFRCLGTDLLLDFQNTHPNITLEYLELPDAECGAYVEADSAHFGLLAIPANHHGDRLRFTVVKSFPLFLFVHKDNPLARCRQVNFSQLKGEKFLIPDKKSYFRKVVKYCAHKYRFEPKAVFESSDANQLISMVNRGRGIALSPAPLLDNAIYRNVVMVPFDDKRIAWSVAFFYQDYEKLSSAAQEWISYVTAHVK